MIATRTVATYPRRAAGGRPPRTSHADQLAALYTLAAQREADLRSHLQQLADSPRLLDPTRLRDVGVLLAAALQAAEALEALEALAALAALATPPLAVVS